MTALMERIETLWCETMHRRTMWPIHGKYRCADCFREYEVPFEQLESHAAPARPSVTPSFQTAR